MPENPGPLAKFSVLKVYFDSGLHSARLGFEPRATLGFAIFPESATRGAEPIAASMAGSGLGGAIGYWHTDGRAFLDRVGEAVSIYPATRGSQLYDLVAADGAAQQLRVNEFHGKVRMIGDSKQVIEFLNGRDSALHLEVAGQDLALTIRAHIREGLSELGPLTWE